MHFSSFYVVPRGAGSFFHYAGHHEPFEGVVYNPASANGHTRFYIRPKNETFHKHVVVVNDHSDNKRSDGHYRSTRHRHLRVVTPDTVDKVTHALLEAHQKD